MNIISFNRLLRTISLIKLEEIFFLKENDKSQEGVKKKIGENCNK